MSWLYYVGRIIVRMLLLFTRWQVRGKENVPGQGALLIVANHLGLADPPLIGASLSRRVTYMAKEELFRSRFSSYFLRSLGAFPVYRGKLDRKALRQAGQLLAQGKALVMFPEGTRSKNARLQPAFYGSALIAFRNSVPILPVGITGTERIKGVAWILHRPQIVVNIGPPFYFSSASSKLTRAELARLTEVIMEHIAELLPPEYRGNYARRGD